MALHYTLSEMTLRRSIRKYFVDTFQTGLSIPVYFDKIERLPDIDKWLSVIIDTIDLTNMATVYLQVYVCTRKDVDYTELAGLRDLVFEELIDLDKTDGTKRIPFYDDSWTIVGWFLAVPQSELGTVELDDGTVLKVIPVDLRYGCK